MVMIITVVIPSRALPTILSISAQIPKIMVIISIITHIYSIVNRNKLYLHYVKLSCGMSTLLGLAILNDVPKQYEECRRGKLAELDNHTDPIALELSCSNGDDVQFD